MAGQPTHAPSPRDVAERLAAERAGRPFLLLRDGDGEQRIITLPDSGRVSVGRDPANEVCLGWDLEVSRLHAELNHIGGSWTVADDGISRNGSYINGERMQGRKRLRDGDQLLFGRTSVTFRSPAESGRSSTLVAAALTAPPKLTDAQRRVLVALCRPYGESSSFATPATNRQIAEELYLSIDAVKTHLRTLGEKLDLADLPQNIKRARMVERAFELGLVTQRDLSA